MATVKEVAGQFAILLPKLLRGVKSDFLTSVHVTSSQMVILMAIHDRGRSNIGELARELNVSMPTVTGLSDRLVRGGYLKRSGDPDDRRVIILGLTNKGRKTINKILDTARNRWAEVLVELTYPERAAFLKMLKKVVASVSKRSAGA